MGLKDILNQLDDEGDGFDLGDLKNIRKLDFSELLGIDFIKEHTNFSSIHELLTKVGVEKPEDLADADQDKLNDVVNENSPFSSWKDLVASAKKFIK